MMIMVRKVIIWLAVSTNKNLETRTKLALRTKPSVRLTNWLANSVEQSLSSEKNMSSAGQEIHHIFWSPKVLYHTRKSPSPAPILSQINPFHAPSHFLKINFNIIFPSTPGSCKWSLSLTFPRQNPVSTSSLPSKSSIPCQFVFLDLFTLI